MSKEYFHRNKLTAVPANGYIQVYAESNEGQGAVPQYLPTTLLSQPVEGALTPVYADGANQSLSGAGAVDLVGPTTFFTSTGVGNALTLADATIVGLTKTVVHVVDGGSGVLTPATFADGTDITFTNAGESWTGIWTGTAWSTVTVVGAVVG